VLIKVLFIGGYGRSGSTVLDRVLGSIDGVHSVGELRHVFREGYRENRLCGCGQPFADCPFWAEVTARAFGSSFDAERMLDLQRRVDRWWRLPRLVGDQRAGRRGSELRAYRVALGDLYSAIAEVSGSSVLVDSSKDVSHGYVIRGIGAPVKPYVLHLVRDSRAVAHSWQRRKFNPGSGADMDRYGLVRTSAEWSAINLLTGAHAALGPRSRYMLGRYGGFTADPAGFVDEVLEFIGERQRPSPVGADKSVELAGGHTVAGNPNRFDRGRLQVRADEAWRTRMPRRSRALVTALTFPLLVPLRPGRS
jgi:hypothetical protein